MIMQRHDAYYDDSMKTENEINVTVNNKNV